MKNNSRVNKNYIKKRRINPTPQTPARSSPNNSVRACLCKDAQTYSKECCDGSIWAQGIGVIQKIT